jgi:PH domain
VHYILTDDYGREYCFGITPTLSRRTYVLSADSAADRDHWLEVLSKLGVMYHDGADGSGVSLEANVNARNRGSTTTKVDPRSLKEGFLVKQGGVWKTWHRRYFALFSHTLRYFKHKGDVVPAGEVPLIAGAIVQEEASTEPGKPYMFSVSSTLASVTTRKYMICADTESSRAEWIEAIRRVSSLQTSGIGASEEVRFFVKCCSLFHFFFFFFFFCCWFILTLFLFYFLCVCSRVFCCSFPLLLTGNHL